jgi:hypothetical protein
LEEIIKAIHALPKGKAPGHDGIPMEFFQKCANEVAPTLLKAFTVMLDTGGASAFINKGLITLIPKSGDHSKLGNWRPITLLGSAYKILAKALARRIQAFLPDIIRPNQTGFIEGRSILDNTFIAQDSLDWTMENNQDLVLLTRPQVPCVTQKGSKKLDLRKWLKTWCRSQLPALKGVEGSCWKLRD